ncbi:MAG: hypothetical protein K0R75_531 [Paenibacillaceae bacterium]|nr:hypothetical protein [Paenibacillaceae bacterium]
MKRLTDRCGWIFRLDMIAAMVVLLLMSSCTTTDKGQADLADPALPEQAAPVYSCYFGTTHGHDSFSGHNRQTKNTVIDHLDQAKTNGYQFYFITDHSQYDTFTPDSWASTLADVNRYTTDTFVAIRGFEFSENDAPGGHMNIYNTPEYISATAPGVNFPYMYDWMIGKQTSTPVYASFNHPEATQYNNWDFLTPERRDKVTMLEVINGVGKDKSGEIVGKLHYTGFMNALERGWRVAPIAGLDAHVPEAIGKAEYRTGMLATSLTKDGLLDAMGHRRTFATYDRNLCVQYTVNGKIMGSVLDNPATLNFAITVADPDTGDENDKITKIEIIGDRGAVAASQAFDEHSVTWNTSLNAQYRYYFLKIYTAGKKDGATAYAAPVWTNRP